jgi:predicted nuclease with TOPRIM domain
MTQQQFEELKSLIQVNAQGISRNNEMIGLIYEEHGGRLDRLDGGLTRLEGGLTRLEGRLTRVDGRLTRVEVGYEQHSHDLRAVAEGVTGNAEQLDRLAGRFDRFEVNFERFSASITGGFTDHEQRLRALED